LPHVPVSDDATLAANCSRARPRLRCYFQSHHSSSSSARESNKRVKWAATGPGGESMNWGRKEKRNDKSWVRGIDLSSHGDGDTAAASLPSSSPGREVTDGQVMARREREGSHCRGHFRRRSLSRGSLTPSPHPVPEPLGTIKALYGLVMGQNLH
jgi:hypothetical protein